LCCNPKHLLQKTLPEIWPAIKISWISLEVTDNAGQFAANYGECCSSVATPALRPSGIHHDTATGAPTGYARLREQAAGEKIAPFKK
jgi:hypothetical protein